MNVALRPLSYISLCAGGGGLDIAFDMAFHGARASVYVEREAFAVAHLVDAMQKGWLAPAPVWSDAQTFDGCRWRGRVDAVIGGIPCQPHSVAGRKQGSRDARDLWSDARRIIVQSRARIVLIENVRGMLSAGADEIAGAERVWRDLRKLGFRVEGGLFSAEEVGAPHRRERLFILGVAAAIGGGLRRESHPDFGAAWPNWRCSQLEHAKGVGREPRRPGAAFTSQPLANPVDCGHGRRVHDALGGEERRSALEGAGAEAVQVDYAMCRRHEHKDEALRPRRDGAFNAELGLFPPGPGDLDAWRDIIARRPDLAPAVELAVRGMADGLASTRIDWLRLLGNGVVPLQGAYAIRTLAARLASGSAIADEPFRVRAA